MTGAALGCRGDVRLSLSQRCVKISYVSSRKMDSASSDWVPAIVGSKSDVIFTELNSPRLQQHLSPLFHLPP